MLKIATKLNDAMGSPCNPLDAKCLRALSFSAEGCFAPLTAAMGGIIAQEVLKALTGKFTPINQWVSPTLGWFFFLSFKTFLNSETSSSLRISCCETNFATKIDEEVNSAKFREYALSKRDEK